MTSIDQSKFKTPHYIRLLVFGALQQIQSDVSYYACRLGLGIMFLIRSSFF